MLKFLARYSSWIIATFAVAVFCGIFGLTTRWADKFPVLTQNLIPRLEGVATDLRFKWRGAMTANTNLVLVGIMGSSFDPYTVGDEEITERNREAFELMRRPWPWSRKLFAKIIEKIAEGHPKVIVLDIVFASETEDDPFLAEVLKKYQERIVIGSAFINAENMGGGGAEGVNTMQTFIVPNQTVLQDVTNAVGYTSTFYDPGEVFRRGRYRTSQLKEYNPELAGEDDLIAMSALAVEKFNGQPVKTPPYDHSNFINYAGPQGTYSVLPVEQMFVDHLWQESRQFQNGEVFRNKIVMLGPFAEILHDTHNTPWGNMPGPEIQANMMATLLTRSSLQDSSRAMNLALTFAVIAIAALISIFVPDVLKKIVLLLVVGGGFWMACQSAFSSGGTVIPVVPPLFGLVTVGLAGVGFRYFLEQIERRRIRGVLDKYVSKNVAKAILSDSRSFLESLQGRKQPVSVLFSDIRGFTTMTEGSDATQLVAQLNEYFLDMVGLVLKEEGTLQKFIGDAIMAVWGDTHSYGLAKDASGAIRTALQMRAALARANEKWLSQPNRVKLAIGIGINHGDVIVGNIGHPQRMEFTVLGDGVNLAARLESATKQFHTDILVGEEVEKLTRDEFIYRRVGAVAFKGKTRPVQVYFLLGDKTMPAPVWLEAYHHALDLFCQRRFGEAAEVFASVEKQIGAEDYLCQMYLKWCAEYQPAPPKADWDGSFALTEK